MSNFHSSKIVIALGVTVFASACSIAAQPVASPVAMMFKTFTEHPTHCLSLLEGRTPVRLEGKASNPAQDLLASAEIKAMHALALGEQQRVKIDQSLVLNCTAKLKN